MQNSILVLLLFCGFLVTVGSWLSDRKGWDYSIVMLGLGAVVGAFHLPQLRDLHTDPEVTMQWVLPLLLLPAAMKIKAASARREVGFIGLMITAGVVLSAASAGGLLAWMTGLPVYPAALLGVALAPTDPISVVSLFKRLGAPHRLTMLVELDALGNDGTTVVLFKLALSLALAAIGVSGGGHGPDTAGAVLNFLVVSGGSALIGVVMGGIFSYWHKQTNHAATEIFMTLLLTFSAGVLAESLHWSGVIAVVAAALVLGNVGTQTGMSPQTLYAVNNFWETVERGAVGVVFLLMGLDLDVAQIGEHLWLGVAAIAVGLVSRAVSVYPLAWVANRWFNSAVPRSYQHVLWFGGLRGAVSLALVLTIPPSVPYASAIRVAVYSVVLWNNVVHGLLMKRFASRLGLLTDHQHEEEYDRLLVKHTRLQAAFRALISHRDELPAPLYEERKAVLEEGLEQVEQAISQLWEERPHLKVAAEEHLDNAIAWAELQAVEKLVEERSHLAPVAAPALAELHQRLTTDEHD